MACIHIIHISCKHICKVDINTYKHAHTYKQQHPTTHTNKQLYPPTGPTYMIRGSIHMCVRAYIPLHYIALHCPELHNITLHYITLNYITLHYTTLHCMTLHTCCAYITYTPYIDCRHDTHYWHTIPYMTLPYPILPYLTLPYIALHRIALHYVTLHYITLHAPLYTYGT